jgi:hypothetical protein
MKNLIFLALLVSTSLSAQIAPECAGITKPADYNEEKQQAFMENFYIAHFMPPVSISSHPADGPNSNIGLMSAYIARLSCLQRLAMNGTKTEENVKSPILPRIRFASTFFSRPPWSISLGVNFLPPLPIPHFVIWHSSLDTTLSYEFLTGLALSLRGFLSLAFIRAEIAGPFKNTDPLIDDWFNPASMGTDGIVSMRIILPKNQTLYPFASFGLVKGTSIFVVGDDDVPVYNEKYALFSPTFYAGVNYHAFEHQLQVGLSGGGAINTMITGQLSLAYGF